MVGNFTFSQTIRLIIYKNEKNSLVLINYDSALICKQCNNTYTNYKISNSLFLTVIVSFLFNKSILFL